jgi:hypothetical protein
VSHVFPPDRYELRGGTGELAFALAAHVDDLREHIRLAQDQDPSDIRAEIEDTRAASATKSTRWSKESGKEEGQKLTTNLKQRVEQTGTGSQPATHPS